MMVVLLRFHCSSVLGLGLSHWHVELVGLCVSGVLVISAFDVRSWTGTLVHSDVLPLVGVETARVTSTETNAGTVGGPAIRDSLCSRIILREVAISGLGLSVELATDAQIVLTQHTLGLINRLAVCIAGR